MLCVGLYFIFNLGCVCIYMFFCALVHVWNLTMNMMIICTAICQGCFELDSCSAQGVGLDALVGPFQLYYSMILRFEKVYGCVLYF